MKAYTLLAGTGWRVTLSMSTDWHNGPDIRLYDPDGYLLDSISGYDQAELSEVLPISGKYTVLVGDYGGDNKGNYQFTITVPSRLGDFSGDGTTDAWDITYLARHIAGILGYETLYSDDISGDGVVDVWDCTYLARAIAGIPGYNL